MVFWGKVKFLFQLNACKLIWCFAKDGFFRMKKRCLFEIRELILQECKMGKPDLGKQSRKGDFILKSHFENRTRGSTQA